MTEIYEQKDAFLDTHMEIDFYKGGERVYEVENHIRDMVNPSEIKSIEMPGFIQKDEEKGIRKILGSLRDIVSILS